MNPPLGEIRLEISAIPHDAGLNGEHWSSGIMSAADAVTELRNLADFIDRHWRETQECNCSASPEPVPEAPTILQPGDDGYVNPFCAERWPECQPSTYDPRCCRFPKSCSCHY